MDKKTKRRTYERLNDWTELMLSCWFICLFVVFYTILSVVIKFQQYVLYSSVLNGNKSKFNKQQQQHNANFGNPLIELE